MFLIPVVAYFLNSVRVKSRVSVYIKAEADFHKFALVKL